MKFPMLLEFTINSIQITSLMFQFITMDIDPILIFRITYSSLMIIQTFLLAWHANEITEQSLLISQAIYESRWYELHTGLQRILHLVMIRAQRPLTLSIGPFFTLTNGTAVTTMKAAYSYLTILKRKYSTHQ
ncbi:odorant receptor 10 [Leptinotarsa decemlineata]|uniref:odorant receptor 10 n=1 Tax=Leptinotarsa decemlineata TaxID=7539 RepID=UPI000C253578|nr:odorant receptor Or2-like [Leptinotarsa decemlineata]